MEQPKRPSKFHKFQQCQILIDALRTDERCKMFKVDKLLDEMIGKLEAVNKHLDALGDSKAKMLSIYQKQCEELRIDICFDINEALRLCAQAYSVIYVADIDIYVVTKNKEQQEQLMSVDWNSYGSYVGGPEVIDRVYQIVLGSEKQRPLIIFYNEIEDFTGLAPTTESKEAQVKNNEKIKNMLNELGKFFKCEITMTETSTRVQYLVDKKYENYAECAKDIEKFLATYSGDMKVIRDEIPRPIAHFDEKYVPTSYLKYPVPRNSFVITGNTVRNIYVFAHNGPENRKEQNITKFVTKEQIREWISNNPPPETMKRGDYLNKARYHLGLVRPNDFSNVVKEKYHKKQMGNSRYWEQSIVPSNNGDNVCRICDIMTETINVCCKCQRIKNKKEHAIVNHIRQHVLAPFIHNSSVMLNKLSKRRPDLYFELANHSIIVEIDEFQHCQYSDEDEYIRMKEIVAAINKHSVVFIRFNPDVFKHNGQSKNIPLKDRMSLLIDIIQSEISRTHTKFCVEKICLFFDVKGAYSPIQKEVLTSKFT